MVEIEEWAENTGLIDFVNTESGEEVILCAIENEYFLEERRIPRGDFERIFGPVIKEAEDTSEITGQAFMDRFDKVAQEETEEGEEPTRLGYESVIRNWVDHGPLSVK